MKRIFLFGIIAIAGMACANAQQISVVSPGGETKLYLDLNLAIQEALSGSTIYLSGGGFQISDNTKITKKLTFMGISHRPDNGNSDGNSTVTGNFFFESGSDGSAVMGLFVSGNVTIGTAQNEVNNFLLRYCNVNSVQVGNSKCQGVLINQNYIRNSSNGGNSPITFSNNILHSLSGVTGGTIEHNTILHTLPQGVYELSTSLRHISNATICNNVIYYLQSESPNNPPRWSYISNCIIYNNAGTGNLCSISVNWSDVFVGPNNGIDISSNFHLRNGAWITDATDSGEIGIYGGTTGFKDSALPPGPRIVSSRIADQTDAAGNLSVEITVSVEQ